MARPRSHGRGRRRVVEGWPNRPRRLRPARPSGKLRGEDFYPDLIDKAAVLTCRLAWNHPLVEGNKRSSWASLVLFLDLNGVVWDPDPPDVDGAESAMLAVAAHEVDETWFAAWLRQRTQVSGLESP